MAPELLENLPKYSVYSDVYAFAMIIYELLEEKSPWVNVNIQDLKKLVIEGKRPTLSINPTDKHLICLKSIMEQCWKQDPKERLKFEEICEKIEQLSK